MAEPRAGGDRTGTPNLLQKIISQGPPEVPVVEVVTDIFDDMRFVSATSMAGLLAFAKIQDEDKSVLLPFVETRIEGEAQSNEEGARDPEIVFRGVLTLENAAFLTVNLVSDMRSACEELATLSGGAVQVERKRLELARYLLANAARDAIAATSRLTAILESSTGAPTEAAAGAQSGGRAAS